jgi:glutamate carboxypeptidase
MSQTGDGVVASAAWAAPAAPLLHRLDEEGAAIIARTEAWARINSGSYGIAGLSQMRGLLADAFAVLPGEVQLVPLSPTKRVRADGETSEIEHGASIRVRVRRDAPIQVALTGHYDTVFPASHPFQTTHREGDMLHGPGTADMKGGLSPCSRRCKRSRPRQAQSTSVMKSCSAPMKRSAPPRVRRFWPSSARAHISA